METQLLSAHQSTIWQQNRSLHLGDIMTAYEYVCKVYNCGKMERSRRVDKYGFGEGFIYT